MQQSRRERLRETTHQEIKDHARQQMYEGGGVATISLRGIASSMGMTAPAIYRYFPSRDELITALILDAYTALGDAVHAACATQPEDYYANRFYLAALAYRDWALAQPADFDLIFGRPLPGYQAPAELTVPLVQRAFAPFMENLQKAWVQGQLKLPESYIEAKPELQHYLTEWLERTGNQLAIPVIHFSLAKWGQMHGMIALELNGQLHPLASAGITELYQFEIRSLLDSIGLPIKQQKEN
jgi:AcrR family transcriptional regulator